MLVAFARACPGVDVSIHTGTTEGLIEAVVERRLEGALVAGPVDHAALVEAPVVIEQLVLVTAPGLNREVLATPELKLLVFRQGCSYRRRFEAWLAAHGRAGYRTLEFGTLDGILGCVSAGLGVSFLPRAVCESWRKRGAVAIHPLGARSHVSTVFVRRRAAAPSRALERFLETARRVHRVR